MGRLDINQFALSFGIAADQLAASRPTGTQGLLPAAPRMDPAMSNLLGRVSGWLEPALLSQSLGVTTQSRLSRPDFGRMVLAMEAQLGEPELDRLFQTANMTGNVDVDIGDFVRRFTGGSGALPSGPGVDQWAMTLLRRIAFRLSP